MHDEIMGAHSPQNRPAFDFDLFTLAARQERVSECKFAIGDFVHKKTGDYRFEGVVVAVFTKINPDHVRLVVEDDRGILHVYSEKNLDHGETPEVT